MDIPHTLQGAPISAFRCIAPGASIESREDTDKVVVNLAGNPQDIAPMKWVTGGHLPSEVTLPRYTNHQRLESVKTLDHVW
jgi:hypothetical protein